MGIVFVTAFGIQFVPDNITNYLTEQILPIIFYAAALLALITVEWMQPEDIDKKTNQSTEPSKTKIKLHILIGLMIFIYINLLYFM